MQSIECETTQTKGGAVIAVRVGVVAFLIFVVWAEHMSLADAAFGLAVSAYLSVGLCKRRAEQ